MTLYGRTLMILAGITIWVIGGASLFPVVFSHLTWTTSLTKKVSIILAVVSIPLIMAGVALVIWGFALKSAPLDSLPRRISLWGALSAALGFPLAILLSGGWSAYLAIILALFSLREILVLQRARGFLLPCFGYISSVMVLSFRGILYFVGA